MLCFRSLTGILCLFVFISIAISLSCNKHKEIRTNNIDPTARANFFALRGPIDSLVASIASSIRRQDQKRNLVQKLITKAGYPQWDKARVAMKNNDPRKMVYIPFVMDKGKQTKAILIVKVSDKDTFYHLLYGSRYNEYSFDESSKQTWNAKDIFHAFLLFDYKIFSSTAFRVTDPRLTNDTPGSKSTIVNLEPSSLTGRVYSTTSWVTIVVCHECGTSSKMDVQGQCCNAEYYDVSVTYWFDDDDDTWGWYTDGGGGGSSGGGANDIRICDNCNWEDTNPCELDAQGHAVSFCDENWEPPTITAPAYNPLNANAIQISSGLESVFPCVASFIRDSLGNGNILAQLVGADVYRDSAYINLVFDTATDYTTEFPMRTAYTKVGHVFVDESGTTTCTDTIRFNPWYLRHGTKEFMVSNALHEIMHAVFNLRWKQYQNWLQYNDTQYDSNYLKNRYPMYWYAIQNRPSGLSAADDHEIMASAYLGAFTNIMKEFYNPTAPRAIRDTVIKALGYHGVQETTAWKALPSQGIDTCKYRAIQISANHSGTNLAPGGCSPSYYYNYSIDLRLRPACQ